MRRLGSFLLAAVVVVGACGDDGASRDDQGNISDTGVLSVFSFRVGDCFDDPASDTTEVAELSAVPCSQPHDNEIYYSFEMPDGDFPGSDAIMSTSADECLGSAFSEFVGITYDQSVLDVFPVNPTEASWAEGDRTVYCALFNIDLAKLTGSARGTQR